MSTPEIAEFHPTANPFALVMVRFSPLLALFFLVAAALGSIAFGGRLVPGLVVGGVAVVILVVVVWRRFRHMVDNTVIRFSPAGVELVDAMGIRVRLAWANVTRVGKVSTAVTRPVEVEAGDYTLKVVPMQNLGLVGWGERHVPTTAPAKIRETARHARVHPQTGLAEVGIPLSVVDKTWTTGQIGQIVRQYRPDLLPLPQQPRR